MSSFLFQREQIHCNCFDNSPKNGPRIFRIDSQHSTKSNHKQSKQQSGRNLSQQGKHKKKSLKKERHLSNVCSQKDPKQKDQINNNIYIPDIQSAFNSYPVKKQQKCVGFEYFQQPGLTNIKIQRNKQAHNLRSQRPQVCFEPMIFQVNYNIPQHIPSQIQSQKKIIDDLEYDIQITQQFEKDFKQFKLHMDMLELQKQQGKINLKKRKQSLLANKGIIETVQKKQISSIPIRYPATQHIIPVIQNQKIQHRVASFRGSAVSNREKISNRKVKDKILPKQIQSQKGSDSQSQSSKQSVFLGRGFDGMTQKLQSMDQIGVKKKKDKQNIQTMITQQSQIKNSQINTLTQYSHTLTSPKSMCNKGMVFGGGQQYGVAGMSYQHIADIRRPKIASSSKLNI